ncbi:MAG: hypothetical protein FWB79_06700 [Treponema sp.]|nr:hypothetical protein [Treponema sp.]
MKEHLEHLHGEEIRASGKRALIAAIVTRAVMDAAGREPACGEAEATRAMAFILSERCRLLCLELGMNYGALRKRTAVLFRGKYIKSLKIRPAQIRFGRGRSPKNRRAES